MAFNETPRNHPEPEPKGLGLRGLKWYFGILVAIAGVYVAAGAFFNHLDAIPVATGMAVGAGATGVAAEVVVRIRTNRHNHKPHVQPQ